jgi:hypothetical protein
MKLEEMADLLDGLASFLDRFGTKTAHSDLQTVSACFRAFPTESVSSFCSNLIKAKQSKPIRKTGAPVDEATVHENVAAIREFLDHRHDYDYDHIDRLLLPIAKLKVPEIKAIGERIGCTLTAKTKAAMVASLKNWLSSILLSHHQSSFSLDAASSS